MGAMTDRDPAAQGDRAPADWDGMDQATPATDAPDAGADASAPGRRGPSWLTGRVAILLTAVLALGAVAGWRVVERLERPAAGGRYEVAYEGDDGCGWVHVRVDGLVLRGQPDLDEPPVPAGSGPLVLRRVWDLRGGGLGVSGVLTLEDGTELGVEGGTASKVFFTLGCAIRSN